ncbi:SfnB family sulfur acquisition oxidoreductase [Pseudoxanthobacter sp.]|uniref:SfnB family sulfur acquisition oxidoreductase n=1 Tax=Pseudoxanthobacter sp. TaxID=1925742 RepID=UPI002FE0D933
MTTVDRSLHNQSTLSHARPAPHIAPRRAPAHRIRTDAEAIEIARRLAEDFAREAAERDRTRRLPIAEIERYSQSGLWGITVPKDFGGAGVSNTTLAEVVAIISAADSSIGQIPQNHFYMVEALRLGGSEEQKRVYFERVLDGDRLGNAFTEIGTKTPVDYKTRVLPKGDGFVLNGQKFYSTGALFAHLVLVVARDADDRDVIVFLERNTPGLTLVDDWSSFGQRTTGSGSTYFDDIAVTPFQIVPHSVAFDVPTPMGPVSQIIHSAVEVGIARGALAATIDYVRQYTRPFYETNYEHGYEDPHIIHAVGELAIRVNAAGDLLARAGRITDAAAANPTAGTVAAASVAVAEIKAYATEVALQVSSKLFELAGARATLESWGLDRFWRGARTHTLHDPVRWKYHHIGNYYLNQVNPPRHGAL